MDFKGLSFHGYFEDGGNNNNVFIESVTVNDISAQFRLRKPATRYYLIDNGARTRFDKKQDLYREKIIRNPQRTVNSLGCNLKPLFSLFFLCCFCF